MTTIIKNGIIVTADLTASSGALRSEAMELVG